MNTFVKALQKEQSSKKANVTYSDNGMKAKKSTLNKNLDLYASMGALRGRYEDFKKYFYQAFEEDMETAMQLLFMLRDIRSGKGERDLFRKILVELEITHPKVLIKVLPLIPKYGRWDDLLVFKTTEIQKSIVKLIAINLKNPETAGLVAKWLPRKTKTESERNIMSRLRTYLQLTPKELRKTLVDLCKQEEIVEQKMCANEWKEINYSKVPSRAMRIYINTFERHDEQGFADYIQSNAKINAGTLYPFEILNRKSNYKRNLILDKMWKSLPNYFGEKALNILPVIDTSASMEDPVPNTNGITCMDVSISLGMYVSERSNGDFKNMFVTFNSYPTLNTISGHHALDKFKNIQRADWGGSTNLERTFHLIGKFGQKHKVKQEDMPEYLMIISDMNFDRAVGENIGAHKLAKQVMQSYGYEPPTIVYWNVNHNCSFVAKHDTEGAVLISGYSASAVKDILQALANKEQNINIQEEKQEKPKLTPMEVMNAALERYVDVIESLNS